jgi:hypothetical protein
LLNGQLQVLQPNGVITQPNTSLAPFTFPVVEPAQVEWPSVINAYGALRPGVSYITLDNPWEPDTSIVGTISINPADDRLLIFNIDPDTAPQNTLPPVTAVINPLISGPGDGLPAAAVGQRYLITESTGATTNTDNPDAWKSSVGQPLIAAANDIIEYTGTRWRVEFNSRESEDVQYVTNINTSIQYKWTGAEWVKSIDGIYPGGAWNIIL